MTPKAKQPKVEERKYLFVNEDASSIFVRDLQLDREKQSHVQRTTFAQRKLERGRKFLPWKADQPPLNASKSRSKQSNRKDSIISEDRSGSASEAPLSPSPAVDSTPFDHENDDLLPEFEFSFDLNNIDTAFGNEFDTEDAHIAALPSHGSSQALFDAVAPSTIQYPGQTSSPWQGAGDPFRSMEAALSVWAPVLLQYFTKVLTPAIFYLDCQAVPLQQMRHAEAIKQDLERCFVEPAHLYALLAVTSARMLVYEGGLSLPNLSSEDALGVPVFFKTRAMQSLRHQLSSESDNLAILIGALRLMGCARYQGDATAEELHAHAVVPMVANLGGIDKLDDYTKERLIHSYLLSAVQTLRPPQIPVSWDPGSLPSGWKRRLDLSSSVSIASHFLTPSKRSALGNELSDIITDLAELVHTITRTQSSKHYDPTLYQWMALRRFAIDHRILSLRPTLTIRQATCHDPVQQSTRLALLFWIGTTIADPIRKVINSRHCHVLISHVCTDLSGEQYWPTGLTDLHLWICTIGALVAKDEAEYVFFAKRCARDVQKLDLKTLQDYESVLCDFLHLTGAIDASLTALWTHMHDLKEVSSFSEEHGVLPRAGRAINTPSDEERQPERQGGKMREDVDDHDDDNELEEDAHGVHDDDTRMNDDDDDDDDNDDNDDNDDDEDDH